MEAFAKSWLLRKRQQQLNRQRCDRDYNTRNESTDAAEN
jgi:hypothetical protein